MKMKLKLTNKIKNIIVIVLFSALLFVILGAFNYTYHEGYKNNDSSDNDVPKCSDSLDNDDEQNLYDNWFLKTKMVPPICPTCPYYFPVDGKGDDKKDDKKSETDEKSETKKNTEKVNTQVDQSGYQNDNSVNQRLNNQVDNSINQKLNNQVDNSVNNQNDNSVNQNIKQQQSADNKWNNLFGNNSITFGGNSTSQGQPNYNTSQIGTLAGSGQAPYNNNSPVSTPAAAGNKDSCPPCPACERCPEPAFECKKVPNYRSSSMNNYMPVPVLNDFSRF